LIGDCPAIDRQLRSDRVAAARPLPRGAGRVIKLS